ncbi:Lrp/AsnC family transcriptional regulator [Desulfallas sp. Bu1-1]|uniref:LexA family protein n=1 Tax=Desulfallas sp. Bu1-1 TaxID=2787620 RepID=UPI0018A1064A|nr:Lrp/AsnC family transcriptional regulator [Desulfallas sp. Bu1-1]MBF7083785.1 Lrp/AsnC family transcriptional regulator [Desulfallas sp. Bu1-1]
MTLTRRRKEFLHKIKKIYENTGTPVHYITVAEALGVSKWTAYDILKELEKEGYLRSEYSVSREERYSGRSVLLFLPTPKAGELFLREKEEIDHMEEWHAAREKLLEIFEDVKKHGSKKIIDDLLKEMPATEAPIIISTYIIAVLIVYVQNLGAKAVKMIKNLLQPALRPELILSLFAGTVLGATVKNMHDVINGRLADEVGRLQKYISEFSAKENKLLVKFLSDALERSI